ncbi:hypothetical protein MP228_004192 [Amoeboaphelidium protococcarum]|nr:hypothetical protein MP228_004192 [Amoeboaphelidium protococcarum]
MASNNLSTSIDTTQGKTSHMVTSPSYESITEAYQIKSPTQNTSSQQQQQKNSNTYSRQQSNISAGTNKPLMDSVSDFDDQQSMASAKSAESKYSVSEYAQDDDLDRQSTTTKSKVEFQDVNLQNDGIQKSSTKKSEQKVKMSSSHDERQLSKSSNSKNVSGQSQDGSSVSLDARDSQYVHVGSLSQVDENLSVEDLEVLLKMEQTNNKLLQSSKADQQQQQQQQQRQDLGYFRSLISGSIFNKTPSSSNPPSPTKEESDITAEDPDDWEFWGKFLNDIEAMLKKNPRSLVKKFQSGLPKGVRGTVWFHLCDGHPQSFLKVMPLLEAEAERVRASKGTQSPVRDTFSPPSAFANMSLEQVYLELIKIPSTYEKMISRDLARTFPKHEHFRNVGGTGQDSLFNVMKAYSLYDAEVGYCQGLSFIAGAFLLHMPDEQAFSCLVHLLHTYQLRGLFTPRMELLQLKLFQFDRILEELCPKIFNHLAHEGIKASMYASQWFLTLFAYRFPLDIVFRLLDILFAVGHIPGVGGLEVGLMDNLMDSVSQLHGQQPSIQKHQEVGLDISIVIFKFAYSLMKKNEDTILALEFEPLLEFLKYGLFDIYKEQSKSSTGQSAKSNDVRNDNNDHLQDSEIAAKSPTMSRYSAVNRNIVDDCIKDMLACPQKVFNKKKLIQLKKEYEEEVKKTDPDYLLERNLESQVVRLTADLKRSENQLADLNRDHCDLAAQMVTLRVESAKDKDVIEALKKQIGDLKTILTLDLSKLNKEQLQKVIDHEVTADNAHEELPYIAPLTPKVDSANLTLEEQVNVLTKQNAALLEELHYWQAKASDSTTS